MRYAVVFTLFFFTYFQVSAQLEKVIVETYYISDDNDATDTYGGSLESGSTTYRIYLDLLPGTTLKSLFGTTQHPFEIASTAPFFNNLSDGQTFAKEFLKARYQENTVALDTWLTLGQTTKLQAGVVNFGTPKTLDTDGSFVGGVNNDGGSEMLSQGLLTNEDVAAGIPLTESDGMIASDVAPTDWFSFGLLDFVSGEDTTLFGSIQSSSLFYRDNFELRCSGVSGINADSNVVLIAQLTTKGELRFKINFEVTYFENGEEVTVQYVSTNEGIGEGILYSPYLTYPYICGCTDPNFAEFDPTVICESEGACVTPIVYGCLDVLACNYNPVANFHIDALCCYPGYCPGDLQSVCPQLMGEDMEFVVYPNPATNELTVSLITGESALVTVEIINAYGVVQSVDEVETADLHFIKTFDLSSYLTGLYTVKVTSEFGVQTKLFVKI